ncbi:MAG: MOSC domain-containing protein [Candidatus Omnitrophica bacterium]|nr:MOSC domain-containing protein [Candidatus Omnitrophota bacterium]
MIRINTSSRVASINISGGGIPKRPIPAVLIREGGLEGDGHNHAKHYRPAQAVSLQDIEMLEELTREGFPLTAGMTGENIDLNNVNVNRLPIGARLIFEGGVEIEITRKRPPCYVLDVIDPRLKKTIVGRCGVYAKVIRPGALENGAGVTVELPVSHECLVEKV